MFVLNILRCGLFVLDFGVIIVFGFLVLVVVEDGDDDSVFDIEEF